MRGLQQRKVQTYAGQGQPHKLEQAPPPPVTVGPREEQNMDNHEQYAGRGFAQAASANCQAVTEHPQPHRGMRSLSLLHPQQQPCGNQHRAQCEQVIRGRPERTKVPKVEQRPGHTDQHESPRSFVRRAIAAGTIRECFEREKGATDKQ